MGIETIEEQKVHGGIQGVYRHASQATGTPMRFSVFVPAQAADGPRPVLYFLSGLTCTEANFTTKAGAQRFAAERGLIVVAPDTSPRGEEVADDPAYDLGQGAGFYLDATREPWAKHYRMEQYVTRELRALVEAVFPVQAGAAGITGHSMGGHGALVLALRNPGLYRSVSAFAPICAPSRCPWGEKAFTHYLGDDREAWAAHDACALLQARGKLGDAPILVDQGEADGFLPKGQLLPEALEQACAAVGQPLTLRRHAGYDHSYYFITTFIADHIAHHAAILTAQ